MKKHMIFGTATAAYQVEGAVDEDGRTPSIWDTFCKQPGKIENGDNGNVACDHYHLYKDDIALMKELGTDSYRFSISWSRIFPQRGKYNSNGMRYYKRILAELKRNGISAAVTLYHWDLPQWAQDLGGWENRECAFWFLEFATKCFEELDYDVDVWITHNEPWCASFLSYHIGEHAPGYQSLEKAITVAHHLLLSHGLAVKAYRNMHGLHKIGITLNLSPAYSPSRKFSDRLAVSIQDGYQNRWFLEPIFNKHYPVDMAALFAARTESKFEFIKDEDFEIISEPIDFLGINFYSRAYVKYNHKTELFTESAPSNMKQTDMGWDICPESLADLMLSVRTYTALPVYITENGSAWKDWVQDDEVHDADRVDYLLRHLREIEILNSEGLNIAGYYCWSFSDNFEWAKGYTKRFGLVYVDFKTQKRIPKDSFYAYQTYIQNYKKFEEGNR